MTNFILRGNDNVQSFATPGYYFPCGQNTSTTSANLTVGTERLSPFYSPRDLHIIGLFGEVTVVGDSGCKLRPSVRMDNGSGYPSTLLCDGGVIAADAVGITEVACDFWISAGITWIGGTVQLFTVTGPTIRTLSNYNPPISLSVGTALPPTGQAVVGYGQSGVIGAIPAAMSTSMSIFSSVPRIGLRISN